MGTALHYVLKVIVLVLVVLADLYFKRKG